MKFSEKDLLFCLTILECIEKCSLYTEQFSKSEDFFYSNNQLEYNATCHLLLSIGEETKKIDDRLKDEISLINWPDIISVRNRIAHDYRGVDNDLVFKICKIELPILKDAIIALVVIINEFELVKRYLNQEYFSHIRYLNNYLQ